MRKSLMGANRALASLLALSPPDADNVDVDVDEDDDAEDDDDSGLAEASLIPGYAMVGMG